MRAPLLSRSHRRRRRIQFPIEVFFDGDAGKFFTGGWSEVGGNVLNDKIVLGSELIVNGDFANWTGDDPDDWVVSGEAGGSEISEVGTGEGNGGAGTGFCNLFRSNGQPLIRQDGAIVTDSWLSIQILIDTVNSGILRIKSIRDIKEYSTTGSKKLADRSGGTNIQFIAVDNPTDITVDNISVKQLTLTSILNPLKSQFGLSDGFFIDVHINAVTADNPVGVIWNYDGSNNFGMAYMDGIDLKVDKNVAGTYSNLADVAQAVTPDQILRIENPAGSNVLDILYNGVSKATPTIADASVIGNTGIALFSTEANNKISKVVIGKL